jgi:hypothetical protein
VRGRRGVRRRRRCQRCHETEVFLKRDDVCRPVPDIEGMARDVSTRREREAVAAINDDADGADESVSRDSSC